MHRNSFPHLRMINTKNDPSYNGLARILTPILGEKIGEFLYKNFENADAVFRWYWRACASLLLQKQPNGSPNNF